MTTFTCGSNCVRVTGQTVKPGASVVAYWQDGTILAVRGKRRVDLNMMPANDTVITGSWQAAGGDLITNAILYLSAPICSRRAARLPDDGPGRDQQADDDHVPATSPARRRARRHRHRRLRP